MVIKNFVFNGKGWRKWFWCLFFEVVSIRGFRPVGVYECVFKNFKFKDSEMDKWVLARFIYKGVVK